MRPGRRFREVLLAVTTEVLHAVCLGEVLAEVVRGSGLQRLPVPHQGFDRERLDGAREPLRGRLPAEEHGRRHDVLRDLPVRLEHASGLFPGLLLGLVRRVPLLPEELRRAKAQSGPQLPPNDVGPLVVEQRQVAVALDPLRIGVPDDRLGGRPDDERLAQLLAAGVRDHREFGREPLDVFLLALQQPERDEQREVQVLMPRLLEPDVESIADGLPQRVAVRLDHHRPADERVLRQVRLPNDLLVPRGEIVRERRERHEGRKPTFRTPEPTAVPTVSRYLSMSPTTKKIEPRIAMRSGTSVPGRIAGSTLTFEKLAVRIFSRYGSFFPLPTT